MEDPHKPILNYQRQRRFWRPSRGFRIALWILFGVEASGWICFALFDEANMFRDVVMSLFGVFVLVMVLVGIQFGLQNKEYWF